MPNYLFLLFLFAQTQSPTLLQKGLLELRQGDLNAAQRDLQAASETDPQNSYVWSALAEVYVQRHDLPLAASAASEAERLGANNPVVQHALALYYSQIGNFGKAAQSEERFAQSPKADAGAKARAAQWYLASGDPAKALPLAEDAARQDAGSTFALAQSFLRQQQFTEAAAILQTGLKTRPDDPQLILALGVARYGQRRFDDAIVSFLRVIQLDADIDQPYLFLGRMLDQAGSHMDEIAKDSELWAEKNPTNAQAQLLLAKVLLTRDAKDVRVEPLLRRSIELNGRNWEARYQLGVVLESKHDWTAAAEQLRAAAELDNNQPMPHYHLARVYDRLGDAAAASAQRALHRELLGTARQQ